MSSVVNPVGPEEPSTYWRRRAAVIVGLLVVLWLGWWLLQAAFGSNDEPAAQSPSPSPSFGLTMSASPDEEPTGDGEPSAAPSASGSASPSPSPSASSDCLDSDIEVAASTGSASTSVGGGMPLTLIVTNTGSAACNRDLGAGANELRITSGAVLVWSSDFCNPSKASDIQVLEPGKPFTTSATWPGTITKEGCPADQPQAQAGSYKVVGRNGAVESEPVAFTVQ